MKRQPELLVVEDEVILAELLKQILTQGGYADVDIAYDYGTAKTLLRHNNYDVIFLDIRLGKSHEGINLATYIQEENKGSFIFITAQSDPLIMEKAIKTSPVSYLTKPFKKADVLAAAALAIQSIDVKNFITVKNGWSVVRIPCDDIIYVQSDGNYIQMHTKQKQYTLRYTLEWFLEQVAGLNFCRIHRSIIINLDFLKSFDRQFATVSDAKLKISQKYFEDLKAEVKHSPLPKRV